MISQFYIYLIIVLLMSLGRVVWRRGSKPVDPALIVAFIRLDFPSDQRELAQKIAGGLAEIVGLKIKQLRPEHTIKQIAEWANEPISVADLIKIFRAAFNIACDESTTFRALVEMIAAQQLKSAEPESRT